MLKKKCTGCGKDKYTSIAFDVDIATSDGLKERCKLCIAGLDRHIEYGRTDLLYKTYYKYKENMEEITEMCRLFACRTEDVL